MLMKSIAFVCLFLNLLPNHLGGMVLNVLLIKLPKTRARNLLEVGYWDSKIPQVLGGENELHCRLNIINLEFTNKCNQQNRLNIIQKMQIKKMQKIIEKNGIELWIYSAL